MTDNRAENSTSVTNPALVDTSLLTMTCVSSGFYLRHLRKMPTNPALNMWHR